MIGPLVFAAIVWGSIAVVAVVFLYQAVTLFRERRVGRGR